MVCRLTTAAVGYAVACVCSVDVFFLFFFSKINFLHAQMPQIISLMYPDVILPSTSYVYVYIFHIVVYIQELTTNNSISTRNPFKSTRGSFFSLSVLRSFKDKF